MKDYLFYMFSGARSTILDASLDDISPEALGAKLERLIRFQGQPGALSVAQHMMLCSNIAERLQYDTTIVRTVLVHDVGEAFTGDAHGMYKGPDMRAFETQVDADLRARGWYIYHLPEVKEIDLFAREEEKRIIWGGQYAPDYVPGDWARKVRGLSAWRA